MYIVCLYSILSIIVIAMPIVGPKLANTVFSFLYSYSYTLNKIYIFLVYLYLMIYMIPTPQNKYLSLRNLELNSSTF